MSSGRTTTPMLPGRRLRRPRSSPRVLNPTTATARLTQRSRARRGLPGAPGRPWCTGQPTSAATAVAGSRLRGSASAHDRTWRWARIPDRDAAGTALSAGRSPASRAADATSHRHPRAGPRRPRGHARTRVARASTRLRCRCGPLERAVEDAAPQEHAHAHLRHDRPHRSPPRCHSSWPSATALRASRADRRRVTRPAPRSGTGPAGSPTSPTTRRARCTGPGTGSSDLPGDPARRGARPRLPGGCLRSRDRTLDAAPVARHLLDPHRPRLPARADRRRTLPIRRSRCPARRLAGPRVLSEGYLYDDDTGGSVPVRAPSPGSQRRCSPTTHSPGGWLGRGVGSARWPRPRVRRRDGSPALAWIADSTDGGAAPPRAVASARRRRSRRSTCQGRRRCARRLTRAAPPHAPPASHGPTHTSADRWREPHSRAMGDSSSRVSPRRPVTGRP